eukprot:2504585-Amphidinium_carterae.1
MAGSAQRVAHGCPIAQQDAEKEALRMETLIRQSNLQNELAHLRSRLAMNKGPAGLLPAPMSVTAKQAPVAPATQGT